MRYVSVNLLLLVSAIVFSNIGCAQKKQSKSAIKSKAIDQKVYPFSDQENAGGWVLNEEVSDEFDGDTIDTTKWFVEGQNGDYYIWKGRAPSQFAPHNVIVEGGKLKLRTQWEPNFNFAKENYADGANTDVYGMHEGKPLPVTTAGIVSKKRFLNGYMEVKSKAGNAAITAAFWAIGYEQELDVYEQMGNPKIDGTILSNTVRTAIHDWSPPAVRPTKAFGNDELVNYKTADSFHVYGVEWGVDFLKVFRDGKLTYEAHQKELGTDWVLNNPMEVWLDSEIFKWLGVPHKEELPVDFEVEYMRVWQKPSDNLLARDRAFYGFEGPILFENNPRPLTMVPEDSTPNDYQKFWLIDSTSAKYLKIVEGDYASGVNSLAFSGYGKNEKLEGDKVQAITPEGALKLAAGAFKISMKVWLDEGRIADKIHLQLNNPKVTVVFADLTKLARRQWVTVEASFTRNQPSELNDGMLIEIKKEDLPETKAAKLFIDDIQITKI